MGWVAAVTMILRLVPTLIVSVREIVRLLESDNVAGTGAEKKALAMSTIEAGIDAACEICPDSGDTPDLRVKSAMMAQVSGLIDKQVAFDKSISLPHVAGVGSTGTPREPEA